MSYTLRDVYKVYSTEVSKPVDSLTFRDICSDFNIGIMDYILGGKEFNLGSNLSTISITRHDRDPRNPRIDWGESNKYRKELLAEGKDIYDPKTGKGGQWFIYHTDSFYCKFYWNKGRCKIKNKSVYRFDATRGIKGNKEKLIKLLNEDELAYLRFKKK
tara:strand:+ start:1415 stop:1891 length:477 start_codon:yes stop_codon:yes gene_type:complete